LICCDADIFNWKWMCTKANLLKVRDFLDTLSKRSKADYDTFMSVKRVEPLALPK